MSINKGNYDSNNQEGGSDDQKPKVKAASIGTGSMA